MSDEKPSFTNVFAAPGIMECRDHSMNFYKGGPNTVLRSEFPPLPVVKKSGSMSYTVSLFSFSLVPFLKPCRSHHTLVPKEKRGARGTVHQCNAALPVSLAAEH